MNPYKLNYLYFLSAEQAHVYSLPLLLYILHPFLHFPDIATHEVVCIPLAVVYHC